MGEADHGVCGGGVGMGGTGGAGWEPQLRFTPAPFTPACAAAGVHGPPRRGKQNTRAPGRGEAPARGRKTKSRPRRMQSYFGRRSGNE
eukprot:scaffold133_cov103-Isochrysis_galbana.AAC.5